MNPNNDKLTWSNNFEYYFSEYMPDSYKKNLNMSTAFEHVWDVQSKWNTPTNLELKLGEFSLIWDGIILDYLKTNANRYAQNLWSDHGPTLRKIKSGIFTKDPEVKLLIDTVAHIQDEMYGMSKKTVDAITSTMSTLPTEAKEWTKDLTDDMLELYMWMKYGKSGRSVGDLIHDAWALARMIEYPPGGVFNTYIEKTDVGVADRRPAEVKWSAFDSDKEFNATLQVRRLGQFQPYSGLDPEERDRDDIPMIAIVLALQLYPKAAERLKASFDSLDKVEGGTGHKWSPTTRRATVADGSKRVLYKNPKFPGDFRVRKMRKGRDGRMHAIYVKP